MTELESLVKNFKVSILIDTNHIVPKLDSKMNRDLDHGKAKEKHSSSRDSSVLFELSQGVLSYTIKSADFSVTKYDNGSRSWLFHDIETWCNQNTSNQCSMNIMPVMVAIAPPGFGKSVLMAHMCRLGGWFDLMNGASAIEKPERKFLAGAAHFFKYNAQKTLDLSVCFKSIGI